MLCADVCLFGEILEVSLFRKEASVRYKTEVENTSQFKNILLRYTVNFSKLWFYLCIAAEKFLSIDSDGGQYITYLLKICLTAAPTHSNQRWCRNRSAGDDSGRILGFSVRPEPKICEKPDPDPQSLIHFGNSRSLCGPFL